MLLSLRVSAQDAADRKTSLGYEFFVEVPRERWQERVEQIAESAPKPDQPGAVGRRELYTGVAAAFVVLALGSVLGWHDPRIGFGLAAATTLAFGTWFVAVEHNARGLWVMVVLMLPPLFAAPFGLYQVKGRTVTGQGKWAAWIAVPSSVFFVLAASSYFPAWSPWALVWLATVTSAVVPTLRPAERPQSAESWDLASMWSDARHKGRPDNDSDWNGF